MVSTSNTIFLSEIVKIDEEERLFLEEMSKQEGTKEEKQKKAKIDLLKMIKQLYSTSDKNMVEGELGLMKVITRSVILGGAFYLNPLVGIITFFTTLALRRKNDSKTWERLMLKYQSRLEFVEDRLTKDIKDDEKKRLIQTKNVLKRNIEKLNTSILRDRGRMG
jgi:hypothetical protein